MIERRKYTARVGASEAGRTFIYITCPFCGTEVKAYLWSLAGSGKRCTCGAKHTYMNGDTVRGSEDARKSVSDLDMLIIGHMSDGNNEEDVAQILGVTRRRVHFRLQRLRDLFGYKNTTHAVASMLQSMWNQGKVWAGNGWVARNGN